MPYPPIPRAIFEQRFPRLPMNETRPRSPTSQQRQSREPFLRRRSPEGRNQSLSPTPAISRRSRWLAFPPDIPPHEVQRALHADDRSSSSSSPSTSENSLPSPNSTTATQTLTNAELAQPIADLHQELTTMQRELTNLISRAEIQHRRQEQYRPLTPPPLQYLGRRPNPNQPGTSQMVFSRRPEINQQRERFPDQVNRLIPIVADRPPEPADFDVPRRMKMYHLRQERVKFIFVTPETFTWTGHYEYLMQTIFQRLETQIPQSTFQWRCNQVHQRVQAYITTRENCYIAHSIFVHQNDCDETSLVQILEETTI